MIFVQNTAAAIFDSGRILTRITGNLANAFVKRL